MSTRAILVQEDAALSSSTSKRSNLAKCTIAAVDSKLCTKDLVGLTCAAPRQCVLVFVSEKTIQDSNVKMWLKQINKLGIKAVIGKSFPPSLYANAADLEIYESDSAVAQLRNEDRISLDPARRLIINETRGVAYIARGIPSYLSSNSDAQPNSESVTAIYRSDKSNKHAS